MGAATMKYFGFLDHVKVFISGSDARKDKLLEWLDRHDELKAEQTELEQMGEVLPKEIENLLKSGRMDDDTIVALAKKRATLDLLPARLEKIEEAFDDLREQFEGSSATVETAVRKAFHEFFDKQFGQAVAELKRLGVSEEVAKQQALMRDDIQQIDPSRLTYILQSLPWQEGLKARRLLWCYESFEAGFHPDSEEAEKIKKQWKVA